MLIERLVTAINVLVASGFSVAAIIRPQYLVPVESIPTQASLLLAMYAAAPRIPLALFVLGAIYKQATPALLLLGALAGAMQLLDAGIGLFEHDLGKCVGPALYRRPPILRSVSASQIRADHAANQAWINVFEQADILKIRLVLSSRSRGPIAEKQALVSVSKNRRIGGAAIDVFDVEPLSPSHPFRTVDNVLATPHVGYVSQTPAPVAITEQSANILRRSLRLHRPVRDKTPSVL